MAEIHLKVSPIFLGHLKAVVDKAARSLEQRPAILPRSTGEADPELLDAWKTGLLLALREDLQVFAGLFQKMGEDDASITLSDEEAERLLRAASALRLRLCESCLQDISEPSLENGMVEFFELPPETQQIYGIYLFLAGLQEQLVDELDAEAGEWDEQEG